MKIKIIKMIKANKSKTKTKRPKTRIKMEQKRSLPTGIKRKKI